MNTKEKIEVMQAFEDGKEIECSFAGSKEWQAIEAPSWNWVTYEYRIKPEPDPYAELKQALTEGKAIQIQRKGGEWGDTWRYPIWDLPVERYRIKPDPYAELKAALAAGKPIQARVEKWHEWVNWSRPDWTLPAECYRIKPATKQIKMLAYYLPLSGKLEWAEEADTPTGWKRVPAEDKIIEVEE